MSLDDVSFISMKPESVPSHGFTHVIGRVATDSPDMTEFIYVSSYRVLDDRLIDDHEFEETVQKTIQEVRDLKHLDGKLLLNPTEVYSIEQLYEYGFFGRD